MSSELETSGIEVAVGDYSVTDRRRWRRPYQTGKNVHVHAQHYKPNATHGANGSVPLSHSWNVVTRIGIHTQTYTQTHTHTHTHTTRGFTNTVLIGNVSGKAP